MKPSLLLAIVLGAGTVYPGAWALPAEGGEADPLLERVVEMLEQAREEIDEFQEQGGEDDDPEHPGRAWAERLWRYREEHPGTPAAARATTESIHFLLHAGGEDEAIERALALPADDGAWPTLINILFEAAGLIDDYGVFVPSVRERIDLEGDPDERARLRFRLLQAQWVEGDSEGAEAALAELESEAPGPEWRAVAAAAREEIAASRAPETERPTRDTRDLWQRPRRLLQALDLGPGDSVADVGSGAGYFSFHLARAVGGEGRVYAVDIEERLLERARERAAELGLGQIETVLGTAEDPRLPAGSLEAIVVVDAYHEMRSHEAMMAAMSAALAPGGRLAVVDIPAELGLEREEYHERHRIPVELVIEEAARAGLRLHSFERDFARQPGGRRLYLALFERPAGEADLD